MLDKAEKNAVNSHSQVENLIKNILIEKPYIALVHLIKYIQSEHKHQNIAQLIISKSLEPFLEEAEKDNKIHPMLVQSVKNVLNNFYDRIEEEISYLTEPPVATESPVISQTKTNETAVYSIKKLTLDDLKQAQDNESLLNLLNKNDGWGIGCQLVMEKNWPAIREYLSLLNRLSPEVVSRQLHTTYWGSGSRWDGQSFLSRLIKSAHPEADIIFNLLTTYQIQENNIQALARLPSMKQKIKDYIMTIHDVAKRVNLYEQCLDLQTQLGKFCHTNTNTLRRVQYKSTTNTLDEIRVRLEIDKQSLSELTKKEPITDNDESTSSLKAVADEPSTRINTQTTQITRQRSHHQRFFPEQQAISAHNKQDYFTYAVLILIGIHAAFKIYCSYCESEQNESTQQQDESCNYHCSFH